MPGLVIARFDAPLFFANGAVFTGFVRSLVDRADRDIRHVVIAAEPITGIDTTALDELVDLDEWLDGRGIELVFAELKGPVKDRLLKFGTRARFGPGHFYPTVSAAVRALRADREERNHHDARDDRDGRNQGRAPDAGGEPPGDGSPSRSGPPRA
jgi:MFS superfamily sulfate permease-like transporter